MKLTASIVPQTINVAIRPYDVEYAVIPSATKISPNVNPQTINVTATPVMMGVGYGYPIARDIVGVDPYEGEYSVTPSEAAQVLATEGKWARHDIVVQPIPNNYGRIEWNGSVLTVS